jgi:hypothetical protein
MSCGFMRVPSWRIRGELSYARCKELTKDGEYNIADRPKGRSEYWVVDIGRERHPITNALEQAYAFRMYQTHVLTWFEDGTIAYNNYNSTGTREVQETWGPIHRLWNDTQCKFYCKHRFGEWRGNHYPFDDPVVHPDGTVHGLVDKYSIIDPTKRKERMAITKQMRENALPRILLGEFGNLFHANGAYIAPSAFGRHRHNGNATGWHARVPYNNPIGGFLRGVPATSERIELELSKTPRVCLAASDEYDAVRRCVDAMIREYLDGDEWNTVVKVEYPPVQVR